MDTFRTRYYNEFAVGSKEALKDLREVGKGVKSEIKKLDSNIIGNFKIFQSMVSGLNEFESLKITDLQLNK